ncbi:unnamed protein product [Closterium sp. NIES-53]
MRWAEHWQAVVGERGVQPWPSASRVMDAAPPSPADVTGAAVAVWRMRLFPPHMPPAKHWRAEAVAQGAGLGQVTPRKAAAAASPAAADATASGAVAAWRTHLLSPQMPPAKHWRAEALAQGSGLGQVAPREAAAVA